MRIPSWITQHWAALRALIVLTVLTGILYPLVITGMAQIPGLHHNADGSLVKRRRQRRRQLADRPVVHRHRRQPAAAVLPVPPVGCRRRLRPDVDSASNLGPENVVDTLPNPADKTDTGTQSLLTQVCTRSLAVGKLEGVSGPGRTARPTASARCSWSSAQGGCRTGRSPRSTPSTRSARPSPFISTYQGVAVQCGKFGIDYTKLGHDHADPGQRPGAPGRALGRGHSQRQRPRPADQPRVRRPAGAAGRAGPRHRRGDGRSS